MTALYRKYRPLDFDEVVGQEAVVRTLRNAIERDQARQAYLFAGPRGTGKTSLARILAKSLNCEQGPTASPCRQCNSCRTIAAGTSLDVIEMDAASQRGIDDIREIREHVILQPVEGRYKVYILDEAHQLTDAAFNALLKLIEEPPPHLVFIFCTTDVDKLLGTVRSRCQTFRFERPRLAELTRLLRRVADGESIEVPDAGLALVARSARGSFRDAVSTLDQLSAATGGAITVNAVLELLGAVEEEALFRLCDLVVDGDTPGVLTFIEELADQGQDLARLVGELLEHLRHLMLVQHMGEVPDSLPVTDETRDRLRQQANQLGPVTVLRLIDLLAVAVEDIRQGGDPRLPLELALVKVTQPEHDVSREAMLLRLEQLEARVSRVTQAPAPASHATAAEPQPAQAAPPPAPTEAPAPPPGDPAPAAALDLDHLRQQWEPIVLLEVGNRSIPVGSVFRESRPVELSGRSLVVEFPASASFHRNLAEDPKNADVLAAVLAEVTGERLSLSFTVGEAEHEEEGTEIEHPPGEDDLVSLFKQTFDAREINDEG
ncbi:MAG: DNA polymerase III subunit gamma/tau [Gaiellales bacterium]